ncbi:MAG TPA: hypothetical protein VJZ27_12045, partial [Aggregatilineales bacterium]|nr:hypothetical protein [Aggregatilineales bacterium]
MRKTIALVFLVLGLVLVLGVMIAGAEESAPPTTDTVAQMPPEGATYVGSDTCFGCHSQNYRDQQNTLHPHMIRVVADEPAAILADFSSGEDVRMVEALGRAYTAEDVTMTMGNKYRQRYMMA